MTKIIAEIASSHNGEIELARSLIVAAKENGADIVKFQDWRAKNVPDNDPDKARYEMYEFKEDWYSEILDFCKKQKIEFLTTVFNHDRVEYLSGLGLKKVKIASISMTNTQLLKEAAHTFDEVIVSTGMHSLEEVKKTVEILNEHAKKYTIMHCVANYPTALWDVNLKRLNDLKEMTSWVGYSDHSQDPDPAKAAMAMGIEYLEKHFTLSRYLPQTPHQMYENGPFITTHEIAIEPHELRELAHWRDKMEIMSSPLDRDNVIEMLIKERYFKRYGS